MPYDKDAEIRKMRIRYLLKNPSNSKRGGRNAMGERALNEEEAWDDYSTGFTWRDEEQRYGEYRAFLAGFNYALESMGHGQGGF